MSSTSCGCNPSPSIRTVVRPGVRCAVHHGQAGHLRLPRLIHRLAYRRTNHKSLHVRGFKERGTTTTPFDMVMLNDLDRHCIADGIAATHVLASLSDDGDDDSYVGHIRAAKEVSPQGLALPKPNLDPRTWVGGVWHASSAVTNFAARAAEGAIEIAAGMLRPAAASSLNGPVTNLRRYSVALVSLDDMKKVCRAFDVTLNDVALAAITDSYRALLLRHGEHPRGNSLRTLVPVSVRSANAFGQTGNQVSIMLRPSSPSIRKTRRSSYDWCTGDCPEPRPADNVKPAACCCRPPITSHSCCPPGRFGS